MQNQANYKFSGQIVVNGDRTLSELWLTDGIASFRPPTTGDENYTTLRGTVLPGLVDMHCHIGLNATGVASAAETLTQIRTDLATGVLAIRDCGSPQNTAWLQTRQGMPMLIRSGQHLARPKRYIRNFALELEHPRLLPEAVATQAQSGDGWVKIVADWIDREVGDLTPLFEPAILREAVAAAHQNGARLTAHTFSSEAIPGLLTAEVDCIEHGTGLLSEHRQELARRRVPVVPTMLQIADFINIAAAALPKFPVFASRMNRLYQNRYQQLADLVSDGVQVLTGTDAGGTVPHGEIVNECLQMQKAGLSATEVLAASSWKARDFLALPAAIAEGEPASLVFYTADPFSDLSALSNPGLVVSAGVLVNK